MDIAYRNVIFDLFGTLIDDDGRAIRGARALLERLPPKSWAIVTSAPRAVAISLISKAELPDPTVLITGDDVRHNKPAPDGYRQAVMALDGSVTDALVIEDSVPGIAAAVAAGCDVVALQRGRDPAFARAATYVIGELHQLQIALQNDGSLMFHVE